MSCAPKRARLPRARGIASFHHAAVRDVELSGLSQAKSTEHHQHQRAVLSDGRNRGVQGVSRKRGARRAGERRVDRGGGRRGLVDVFQIWVALAGTGRVFWSLDG